MEEAAADGDGLSQFGWRVERKPEMVSRVSPLALVTPRHVVKPTVSMSASFHKQARVCCKYVQVCVNYYWEEETTGSLKRKLWNTTNPDNTNTNHSKGIFTWAHREQTKVASTFFYHEGLALRLRTSKRADLFWCHTFCFNMWNFCLIRLVFIIFIT